MIARSASCGRSGSAAYYLRAGPDLGARVERACTAGLITTGSARAASWFWRAEANAAGLLDERYFMYLEDVDFALPFGRGEAGAV